MKRGPNRRRVLAGVATGSVASLTAFAGCLGEDEDGAADDETVVEIETREGDGDEPEFVFDPDIATLEAGTTVRWHNTDGVFHTVTATDSLDDRTPSDEFDTELPAEGDAFEWTADVAGVQHYYCEPHAGFMIGSLVIGDVDEADLEAVEAAHEDEESANDEPNGEFVDMTGVDVVEIETREGDADADEPNFVFDPAFVRVDAGTTIEWVNTDGVFHTVTSTDDVDDRSGGGDAFDATLASAGATFEWDADDPGTQSYYCSPHAGFMYGVVEIE